MITIVNYGMGNLGSIQNMLKKIGQKSSITSDIEEIKINYPWITIIQDDFNDLNDIGTHDGYKVLDSIIKILNNK